MNPQYFFGFSEFFFFGGGGGGGGGYDLIVDIFGIGLFLGNFNTFKGFYRIGKKKFFFGGGGVKFQIFFWGMPDIFGVNSRCWANAY